MKESKQSGYFGGQIMHGSIHIGAKLWHKRNDGNISSKCNDGE